MQNTAIEAGGGLVKIRWYGYKSSILVVWPDFGAANFGDFIGFSNGR